MLIILLMSYFLHAHVIGLLTAGKTVSQQKKGQNLTSFISKFTMRVIEMQRNFMQLDAKRISTNDTPLCGSNALFAHLSTRRS